MNRRHFLQVSAAAAGGLALPGKPVSAAPLPEEEAKPRIDNANWYAQVVRKIHFDMHTPGTIENVGRDFDPQAFARAVKEAKSQAVCFFARCGYDWSYYPTKVGCPHPHLARDLFGDGLKALKAEGIRVIAYLAIDGVPAPLVEAHPEWCLVQEDGSLHRSGSDSGCAPCMFGRYPEEQMIAQYREIAEMYPVDGFFLDGIYEMFAHVCYCARCRKAFGRPIPSKRKDPDWRAYRQLQVDRMWDVIGRAAEEVAKIRPGCLLGVNWMASTWWSVPPPKSIGYLTGDPPTRNEAFEAAFHLATWAWRDKPADLMTQRMLHSWQDFTLRTPETIETEFATGLAGGGRLFIGDLLQPVEGKPDPEVMRLFRRCFEFAEQRESVARLGRRKSDIAILSSPETLRTRGDHWAVDDIPLRGALLPVIEDGLTADILYDLDVPDQLGNYQALIVPEQAFVGRRAAQAIANFVEKGGGLVVTGRLPKAVDPREPDTAADGSIFEQISGLVSEGEHPFELGYLRLRGTEAESFWRDGDDFRPPIPVPGKPAKVQAIKARTLAPLTAPGELYQLGAKPPGKTLQAPALTLYEFGKGSVLFCALPIAADVWKRGNPGAKYLLQKMVRRVIPGISVERVGPPSVQIWRSEAADRTVVHLVAYQPDRRTDPPQVIESPSAISDVRVKLFDSRTPKAVRAEPSRTAAKVRREGRCLIVDVPSFVIHTAVVFEWT